MSERDEFLWAIGLFEGEGSIALAHRKNRIRIQLALSSTDEDVVRRFHAAVRCGSVGGPYARRREINQTIWKPRWDWRSTDPSASILLKRMLPALCTRRAETAREKLAAITPPNRYYPSQDGLILSQPSSL